MTNMTETELAQSDFELLYRDDPREAEDRLILLLIDPELVAKRIVFLRAVAESATRDNLKKRTNADFSAEIAAVRKDGVLTALSDGKVTFERLDQLTRDPEALLLAHQAIVEGDIDDEDDPNGQESEKDSRVSVLDRVLSLALQCRAAKQSDFIAACREFGVPAKVLSFAEQVGADPGREREFDLQRDTIYGCRGDRIYIDATLDEIPFGLCWMGIVEETASGAPHVTRFLPELNWDGRRWYCEQSLVDILGRRPQYHQLTTFLIPATQENRADFESDEVRRFVAALSSGKQREKINDYFAVHDGGKMS